MRRLALVAVIAMLSVGRVEAQTPATSRLVFANDMGRTGVLRLRADSLDWQVQAELLDTGGNRLGATRCPVTWRTRDPSVLALRQSDGVSAWVRPGREGITELTAAFACAPSLTRSVPVVVGAAAIDKPFSPSGEGAKFYPARLKVTPPGWAYVSSGKVFLRPIDRGVQLVASAYNGTETLITPAEFPMAWSVSDPGILAIDTAYDHTAFFTPKGTGTATVTFAVEGLRQSFDVTIQDAKPATSDAPETLATRVMSTAPVMASASTTSGTASSPTTGSTAISATLPAGVTPVNGSSAGTAVGGTTTSTTTILKSPVTATAERDRSTAAAESSPPTRIPAVAATGLIAIAGINSVQLKWTPAAGAVGYRIARQQAGTNQTVTITGSNVGADGTGLVTYPEYTDSPLSPSSQYVFYLSTYYRDSNGEYYFPDPSTEARAAATPKAPSTVSGLYGWTLEYNGDDKVVVKYLDRRGANEKLVLLKAKAGYLDQFTQIADLPSAQNNAGMQGVHVDGSLPSNQGFAYKIRHLGSSGAVLGETDIKNVWIAPRPAPEIRSCVVTETGAGGSTYSVRFSVDPAPQAKALKTTIVWTRPGTYSLTAGYGNNGAAADIKKVDLSPAACGSVTFDMVGSTATVDTYYAKTEAVYDNGGAVPSPIVRTSLMTLSPYTQTPVWSGCTVTK